jgi:phage portal protein BeeE
MIERPIEAPKWSPEARARFQEEWHAATSGAANSGRTAILEEGMRWNTASFSPKDSDYIAGRRLTYEEVALQFGLLDIGRASGSSANAAEQSHRERYQDVLGPWLRMLQDDIELQLLPSVDLFAPRGLVYVEFNLKEKLKGSFVEEQKALTTSVGVPHMTVNEGRARMNLPRIEEDVGRHAGAAVERDVWRAAGRHRPDRRPWYRVGGSADEEAGEGGAGTAGRSRRRVPCDAGRLLRPAGTVGPPEGQS